MRGRHEPTKRTEFQTLAQFYLGLLDDGGYNKHDCLRHLIDRHTTGRQIEIGMTADART